MRLPRERPRQGTGLEKSPLRRTMAHFIRVIDSMTIYQRGSPSRGRRLRRHCRCYDASDIPKSWLRSFLYPADPLSDRCSAKGPPRVVNGGLQ